MKILIVEDEQDLLISISNFLTKEQYICELANNFKSALDKVSIYEYDIILLDITIPGGNGLDLLRAIKKYQVNTGVIIVSAKNSTDDKIHGLDMGADDYITKPFHLSELNSRIKAVLRRRKYDGSSIVSFQEIAIDTAGKSVSVNKTSIALTPKEYDLLLFFVINKNRVLTKEALAEHLWSDNIDLADNFDFIYTHLNNLRKKIKAADGTDYIKTIYGMGYKFSET